VIQGRKEAPETRTKLTTLTPLQNGKKNSGEKKKNIVGAKTAQLKLRKRIEWKRTISMAVRKE